MSRRAPQEGRSYEQALYSVVLLVPRLPRPERTGTVRVLLDFIADLWELDRSTRVKSSPSISQMPLTSSWTGEQAHRMAPSPETSPSSSSPYSSSP